MFVTISTSIAAAVGATHHSTNYTDLGIKYLPRFDTVKDRTNLRLNGGLKAHTDTIVAINVILPQLS
jgi:hypothetical protein